MEYRRFGDRIVAKLTIGDGIKESLVKIAEQEKIDVAEVTGIGAVDKADLAFFRKTEKVYVDTVFEEEFEVLSLIGSLTRNQGNYHPHLHIVLGREDLSTLGGHLNEAYTSLTMEIFINIIEGATIERFKDDETGLDLMDLS